MRCCDSLELHSCNDQEGIDASQGESILFSIYFAHEIIQTVDQWACENKKLQMFLLTPEQWILLKHLCSILESCYIYNIS